MRTRIQLSQNFIINKPLVKRLVASSSISASDVVYEIGHGNGIITSELVKKAGRVVAIEKDINLYEKLAHKYSEHAHVKIVNADFVDYSLPGKPFKVFSNIPFILTAAIAKKLLFAASPPLDTYLFMQKEAALKFIYVPGARRHSLVSTCLFPFFSSAIAHTFSSDDFIPRPGVSVVLARFTKRHDPLISRHDRAAYNDFLAFAFSQTKPNIKRGLAKLFGDSLVASLKSAGLTGHEIPAVLPPEKWLALFGSFKRLGSHARRQTADSWGRMERLSGKIQKVHRTRAH